jgi:hypothetical protein
MSEKEVNEINEILRELRSKFPNHVFVSVHKSTPIDAVIKILEDLKQKKGVMN